MKDPAFAPDPSSAVDITTQSILLHASQHDLQALKPLLRVPGNASVQDPETGYTPLHAAIAACGPVKSSATQNGEEFTTGGAVKEGEGANEEEDEEVDIEKVKKVIEELFFSGAIWNDLDANNETPGCLAYRLGRMELYDMCVNAGVRAELLLGLMGGYEELEGEDTDEEMEESTEVETGVEAREGETAQDTNGTTETATHELAVGPAEEVALSHQNETQAPKQDVNSADYLASNLTFTDSALLDSDANGVMMSWETAIMRRTVDLLIPDLKPGSRILNIGFGMGIVDRMFRDTKPARHHILEAHPAVLQKLASEDSDFGKSWEESAPSAGEEGSGKEGAYRIHAGKWQDICPQLLQSGEVYDAIYFDTFGEDYSQLKLFFTEFVPGLLDGEGRFGFFNGLGADRRVCYDVYCKVVEMDALEAGMDVEWEEVLGFGKI
ncbi:Arginine N-methyltransferase 2 [Cadophora gregata]|uniref:Arginine N-methyltransferase 2 n=1 Tax=Cadophora gregata TaxID=51156 RepID=UPI0026DDC6CC|nr:Arginine N-methyltransferase 2 [Cadophora gregata]KAK0108539.1 Arginine N-methyltransferase 2 [Cadophora gregata]